MVMLLKLKTKVNVVLVGLSVLLLLLKVNTSELVTSSLHSLKSNWLTVTSKMEHAMEVSKNMLLTT